MYYTLNADLPTIMSSVSLQFLRNKTQMSIVKIVLLLLKIEVNEDIRAAIITAIIRPGSFCPQHITKERISKYRCNVVLNMNVYESIRSQLLSDMHKIYCKNNKITIFALNKGA